jgi:flagellar assembly factor FliW
LESIGEGPSFTLISPFALREYSFDIPSSLQGLLGITPQSNLLIYNIMILQTPIEKSTINFVAPLIFNTDNQTMAQIIVDNRADFGIPNRSKNTSKVQMMAKSITFIGNGKMALALAKGLCETHAIEVIGRSMAALEQFEQALSTPIKKTLYARCGYHQ